MLFTEDAIDELRSIGDLVRWGASRFIQAELSFGHGTDNAFDDAFVLVRHALHLPHDIPPYMIDARLTKAERRKAVELLALRIQSRKPVPYITSEAWFGGLPYFVDERVLIPRSPISELIEQGFEPWIESSAIEQVLDLCTGSACIAINIAKTLPEAEVDATDLSADALAVAEINVKRHHVEEQVSLIQSDVFNGLDATHQQYDLIVSNPPYVDAEDMARLTSEFKLEPALALAAGKDGLDVVRRILVDAPRFLRPNGILVVEVGNSYPALLEAYPRYPFSWPEFTRGGHGVFVITREELVNQ